MLGIDIGAWYAAFVATRGTLGVGVPLLDPGPLASVLALTVGFGLMLHSRRRRTPAR